MSRLSATEQAAMDSRRTERVYSRLAGVYDRGFDWALGPGRRRAVARLEAQAGQHVLEVGVGTGLSIPHYPRDCAITGIDISEPMLDQARARAQARVGARVVLRRMDARGLEFEDQTFDHVLAPYVMSVVPEPRRVMLEMRRVCKPGGTIVVVNHFRSRQPLGTVERLLSPASRLIGFRLDLPPEVVTQAPGLKPVAAERVNLLGLWQLLILRREGPVEGGSPGAAQ